ncbi:MAG: hypothetical protein KBC84_09170 [Proteobacteria bacterium]|nr:hypothetical protein [Pseudomonadota bacterium]
MDVNNIKDFKIGWFIGNFEPTLFKTKDFEIAHHLYPKGMKSTPHTHKIATEVNYIVRGSLIATGQQLRSGDMFTYYPNEISEVEFLEDTDLIIIKFPSIPEDKYLV